MQSSSADGEVETAWLPPGWSNGMRRVWRDLLPEKASGTVSMRWFRIHSSERSEQLIAFAAIARSGLGFLPSRAG